MSQANLSPQAQWVALAPRLAELTTRHLAPAIQSSLISADDVLFKLAENGTDSAEHMDALRILRQNRAQLLEEWSKKVTEDILEWGKPGKVQSFELSLIDNDELEEELAVQQMTHAFEKQHSKCLNMLDQIWVLAWKQMRGYGFADALDPVLEVRSGTETQTAPVHSKGLPQHISDWLSALQVSFTSKLVLFKIIEREINKVLGEFLPQAVSLFTKEGWPLDMPTEATFRPERKPDLPKETPGEDFSTIQNENPNEIAPPQERSWSPVQEEVDLQKSWLDTLQQDQDHTFLAIDEVETNALNPVTQDPQIQETQIQETSADSPKPFTLTSDMDLMKQWANMPLPTMPSSDGTQMASRDMGGSRAQTLTDSMADAFAKALYQLMGPGNWERQYEMEGNLLNQEIGDNWDPNLQDLLSLLKHRRIQDAAHPRRGLIIQPQAVKTVLYDLQRNAPESVKEAARKNDRSLAQQFKQEMIELATVKGKQNGEEVLEEGQNMILAETDEDAVDIVGMVFEVFLGERHISEEMREKIASLIAPYVKIAIDDRKMFMHRKHPARKLLDAIAEACEGNDGETLSEKMVLDKVKNSIDHLTSEFHEDTAIFDLMEQEICQFVAKQKENVEKTEKRALDTQRSKERLEQAEKRAEEIFIDHMKDNNWPVKTVDMLRTYWTTYHKILILQTEKISGDPARAEKTLHESIELLQKMVNAGKHGVASVGTEMTRLHAEILIMLGASGLVEQAGQDQAVEIWTALDQASRWTALAQAGTIQAVVNTLMEKPTSKIQEQTSPQAVAQTTWVHPERMEPVKRRLTVSDFPTDEDLINYFTNMDMGTWVDFVKPDGHVVPCKLSWVSPISLRLMFVTQKGFKHAVESAQDLAIMVKQDKVRLREFALGNDAFDHSFKKAIEKLAPPEASQDSQTTPPLAT